MKLQACLVLLLVACSRPSAPTAPIAEPGTEVKAKELETPAPPPPSKPQGAPIARSCERMRFEIKADAKNGYTSFSGVLFNESKEAVVLVEAGDGSDVGWRTPKIEWSATTQAGQPAPPAQVSRCGNVNPIQASEIFTLEPEQSHALSGWLGEPRVVPGRYKVHATYINDPGLSLHGIPLGQHESEALEKIKSSTPCRIESNTITVDL